MGPEAKSKKSSFKKKPTTKKTTKNTKATTKQTKPATKEKTKIKTRNIYIVVSAVVLLCVIAAVFMFSTSPSVEAKAKLSFDSETNTVMVKHEGRAWVSAESGMDLYKTDSIKTGDDSTASIILFKGCIIRLDSNTEVTIKEIIEEEQTSVTIEQSTGRTWNTVQKMSGIDSYEVKTPTTVASVRGTSFDINVGEDGITIISVVEGLVNVSQTKDGEVYTIQLGKNYSVTVDYDEMGDPQVFEVDEWIEDNIEKDDDFRADLKAYLYEKIEPYMDQLKNDIGMTGEEIDILIEGYIKGNFEIPPEAPDEFKELFLGS